MRQEPLMEITGDNFARETGDAAAAPLLIDFGAVWCAPCRAIDGHVAALAAAYAGRLRVAKCDVDANPDLVAALDIRSVPTLLVYKSGRVVGQLVGAAPRARLEALVERALA